MPEQHPSTVSKPKAIAILAIVVIIAALVVGVYHERHTKDFVDATTHQPERYTELYFSNPTHLPTTATSGQQLSVDFTVRDVEARAMTYPYTIEFITPDGGVLAQKQASFHLPNGATQAIENNITVPAAYQGKAEVQILLTNLNQTIHFWIQTR